MNRFQNIQCLVAVITLCVLSGCEQPKTTAPAANVATGTVTFEFVIDDKTITANAENVADGASLESVMRGLDGVEIEMSGSGPTAFVNQINGLKTSGSEGWTFEIDGEWADKGVGAIELHPPTSVRWEYGDFEPSAGK